MARRSLRDEFIKRHGNRPAQMATYESDNDPRYGNAPTREEQQWINEGNRKLEVITKPTRDLNYAYQPTKREIKRKTRQGATDFLNERVDNDWGEFNKRKAVEEREKHQRGGKKSGAINVTFGRDKFPGMVEREKGKIDPRLGIDDGPAGGGRGLPKPKATVMPKRGWWNEPKKEYRPEKSAKDRRMELLTGGTDTGGSSYSDRHSLLTGRGLSSNEDRMALLTGRSDPPKEEWKSQYGGRREYDPQDREFNRQFNTEPTNNKDVRSWFPDGVGPGKKYPFGKPDPSHPPGTLHSEGPVHSDLQPSPNTNQGYDDSSIRKRLRALEGRPQTGGWQEDRIVALENRPQSTGGGWDEDRIKALENRKPIVNQPTVDLSGVEGRLSQLEGKGSDWQEDRIAALEGRKPQDLSGIQGRLTSLENYYKNDPPPEESTGNRYEDKMAALLKGWDMTDKATKWDLEDERLAAYKNVRDKSGKAWANTLEEGYVQGVRDLNREYNKPVHTANIKGREYKAYDPKAAARLRYLDTQNIHEDTYLGQGTWQNQYGEDVKGWDRGYQDRYFTSHSGLDKDSDEYKRRFGSHFSGGVGKDYAWYQ